MISVRILQLKHSIGVVRIHNYLYVSAKAHDIHGNLITVPLELQLIREYDKIITNILLRRTSLLVSPSQNNPKCVILKTETDRFTFWFLCSLITNMPNVSLLSACLAFEILILEKTLEVFNAWRSSGPQINGILN